MLAASDMSVAFLSYLICPVVCLTAGAPLYILQPASSTPRGSRLSVVVYYCLSRVKTSIRIKCLRLSCHFFPLLGGSLLLGSFLPRSERLVLSNCVTFVLSDGSHFCVGLKSCSNLQPGQSFELSVSHSKPRIPSHFFMFRIGLLYCSGSVWLLFHSKILLPIDTSIQRKSPFWVVDGLC